MNKIFRVCILTILYFFIFISCAYAQWEIKVFDSLTQGPIKDASIYLNDDFIEKTDETGIGYIYGPIPSHIRYKVKVVANGYKTASKPFDPKRGDDVTFYLDRSARGRDVVDGVITGGGGKDEGSFIINVSVRDNVRGKPISGCHILWYNGIQHIDEGVTRSNGHLKLSSKGDVSRYLYKDNRIEAKASGFSLGRLDDLGFSKGGRTINVQFNLNPN